VGHGPESAERLDYAFEGDDIIFLADATLRWMGLAGLIRFISSDLDLCVPILVTSRFQLGAAGRFSRSFRQRGRGPFVFGAGWPIARFARSFLD